MSGRTATHALGGKINGFLNAGGTNETANTELSEISGVLMRGGASAMEG
jgi:hypothetical protein